MPTLGPGEVGPGVESFKLHLFVCLYHEEDVAGSSLMIIPHAGEHFTISAEMTKRHRTLEWAWDQLYAGATRWLEKQHVSSEVPWDLLTEKLVVVPNYHTAVQG